MNEKKLRTAKALINTGTILRLLLIAVMAVYWACSYTYPSIFFKLRHESEYPLVWVVQFIIIPFFLADIFVTINWKRLELLFYSHFFLYFFYSVIFYFLYFGCSFNFKIFHTGIEYVRFSDKYGSIILASLWVAGLIPFILCWIGKIKLKKARTGQKQINR